MEPSVAKVRALCDDHNVLFVADNDAESVYALEIADVSKAGAATKIGAVSCSTTVQPVHFDNATAGSVKLPATVARIRVRRVKVPAGRLR